MSYVFTGAWCVDNPTVFWIFESPEDEGIYIDSVTRHPSAYRLDAMLRFAVEGKVKEISGWIDVGL